MIDHGAPPHDEEAESSVLGAVMLAEAFLDKPDVEGLEARDFYRPRHQLIWGAVNQLRSAGEPVDTLTVGSRLDLTGKLEEAGGKDYIETLVTRIPAIGNTTQYARVVKENSRLRDLRDAGWAIFNAVADRTGDSNEIMEEGLKLVGQVSTVSHEKSYGPDDLLELAVKHFDGDQSSEVFPLPLPELNEACNGGLRRGQVMAIAAFPNVGKSAFGMDCLESAIKGNTRKAVIYLTEMTVEEINHRIIARQTDLTVKEVIKGNLNLEQYRKLQTLKMPNIEIQRAAGWTVDQIAQDVLRRRPDIVLIDHFHRINFGSGRNKVDAMDEASAKLNNLAKDNHANCVILLVAHLSRPGGERENSEPRPTGRHLRGTQMLEADADIVCMLHRKRDDNTGKRLPRTEAFFIRNRTGDADATAWADFNWRDLRFKPTTKEDKF